MPESTGEKVTKDLAGLKDLKTRFDIARQSAAETGDSKTALSLKQELESGMKTLREVVAPEELIRERIELYIPFVKDIVSKWYNRKRLDEIKFIPEILGPRLMEFDRRIKRLRIADIGTHGRFTMNPETQQLDFAAARTYVKSFQPNPSYPIPALYAVADTLSPAYSPTHYMPGIEYIKWLQDEEHRAITGNTPSNVRDILKNGWRYFLLGSLYCNENSYWCAFSIRWDGSKFQIEVTELTTMWREDDRILFLER